MIEDASTLAILETICEDADLPQRQIAARTGLNLSKVNFVLRALKEKGYLKLKRVRDNPHKWRYLYLLTPEGMAIKSQLAYRFVQRTLKQYATVEARVAESVEQMAEQGVHRVVLWGCTEITELCTRVMAKLNGKLTIVGVVDPACRDAAALSPDQLEALHPDAIVVCEPDASDLPEGIPAYWLV